MSQFDHYRTYLRGELARLRKVPVAANLLEAGMCIGNLLPDSESERLAELFINQSLTDAFVFSLPPERLLILTDCLSRWRSNNVRHELRPSQAVEVLEVDVDLVRLNDAERSLHEAFERNDRLLTRIAADDEVLANETYAQHEQGLHVDLPLCLAKPDPDAAGMFRVIDGVHRAIQLVRNGESRLTLCVFRPSPYPPRFELGEPTATE